MNTNYLDIAIRTIFSTYTFSLRQPKFSGANTGGFNLDSEDESNYQLIKDYVNGKSGSQTILPMLKKSLPGVLNTMAEAVRGSELEGELEKLTERSFEITDEEIIRALELARPHLSLIEDDFSKTRVN